MDERKGLGHSLLLAVAPAVVSSLLTGAATWSLAVRDAKRASTETATEKDQVMFTALRDRIVAMETSMQVMAKAMESGRTRVARPQAGSAPAGGTAKKGEGQAEPAPPTGTAPPAGSTTPPTETPESESAERRVLFEVLDRLKTQLPGAKLPQKVEDLPLYAPKR